MGKETRGNEADRETIFFMICQKDFSRLISRFFDRKGQGRGHHMPWVLEVTNPLSSSSIKNYGKFFQVPLSFINILISNRISVDRYNAYMNELLKDATYSI